MRAGTNEGKPAPRWIIVLTGEVGTGKTSVAIEIGRQVEASGGTCAIVDLDWLGWVHAAPSFREYDDLIMTNLAAVWPNMAEAGAEGLVLARALLRKEPVERLRELFPETPLCVIRLSAAPETIRRRLSARDSGANLEEHVAEAESMRAAIATLAIEHAVVKNDGGSIEDAARAVLARAKR